MIPFLKRLLGRFAESSRKRARVEVLAVGSEELISRFVFSSQHFSRNPTRVKQAAFLPNSEGKTSVFRISGLAENDIWAIGIHHVGRARGKNPHGRADVVTNDVLAQGLAVTPETSTHPLHADIQGWPVEKEKQKLLAMELAARARPVLLEK